MANRLDGPAVGLTPRQVAEKLGVTPAAIRTWLRATVERPTPGQPWRLDDQAVEAARSHFSGGSRSRSGPGLSRAGREASDEAYVLDLCDEVLGVAGERQHRFDWLRGDAGHGGREAHLPVDAFYATASVIVEYRERQHEQAVPIMDSRPTISGVPRGEQRRLYDERREALIPAHGLRLVVIKPDDLGCDRRGRLRRRDRDADLSAVRRVLAAVGCA